MVEKTSEPPATVTDTVTEVVVDGFWTKVCKFNQYFNLLVSAKPSKWDIFMLCLGFIAAVASGLPFPLIGIIFGQLVDEFNSTTCSNSVDPDEYQNSVNHKVLLVLYVAIAQFVLMYTYLACWSLTGARLAQRLREQYLHHLLKQSPTFFDTRPAGQVSSRLNGDIQTIRAGTSEKVGICISSLSFFVTAYIVAFIKQTDLAAMLLSLVPAYFLMSLVGNRFIEKYAEQVSDHIAKCASVALEALSHINVVQAFNANRRLELRFSKDLVNARTNGINKAVAIGIQAGSMYFIAYAANALAFWQGSRSIAQAVEGSGNSTVGKTYTVIFILVDATLVLSQVAPFVQIFSAAVGSANSLHQDMALEHNDTPEYDNEDVSSGIDGHVKFFNVCFEYPSRQGVTVLKDVNMDFPAGKHTAIVGQSGSGKSTIAELITKLYEPTGGAILIDKHDSRYISPVSLRSFIGSVEQNPTLLNRSILENIALGLLSSSSPGHSNLRTTLLDSTFQQFVDYLRAHGNGELDASKISTDSNVMRIIELVKQAATLADADAFIRQLKDGYTTTLGSKGRTLSGGQRQRIALARALVRDPKILILDEATSALDSQTEIRVHQALEAVASGRTLITIAHRLSTIQNADNIIVLRDGRVMEQGTHVTLMAANGAYAEMVSLQSLTSPTTSSSDSDLDSITSDAPKTEALIDIPLDIPLVGDEEDSSVSSKRPLGRIFSGVWRLVNKYTVIILAAFVGSLVVGGSFSAESIIFGNTVGELNTCRSPADILASGKFFALMFFILGVIEFFANIISWAGFGLVSERLLYRVRVSTFKTMLKQNLDWHNIERRTPASLLSIITKDSAALGGISGSVIGTILSILINLVAAIILTTVIAWKIALVCLSTVPLLLGAGLIQLRVLTKFEEKHETAYSESVDLAIEAVESIKTVASFSLEEDTMARYRRALAGPREETTRVSLEASLWQAITYLLGNLSYALAFWWGSKQIIAGTYSTTQFLIVIMALLVSAQLWSQMFALAPELSSARSAVARILNLLDLDQENYRKSQESDSVSKNFDLEAMHELKAQSPIATSALAVEFQNVQFSYSGRPDLKVLHDLTMQIKPGQFTAFVGPSGAGKSTIISLIERLYTPTSGTVKIGGLDINKTRDLGFRDNISLVPQDSALFDGSVRFNVSLGARPGHEATDEEIEEACRLANIHETITKLPEGYETDCGSNGGLLSGGQKQRIAIARALVRKPKLLILDESTSALDAESERAIQESLQNVAGGVTIIAIAHRLNTIQHADTIFVIESGRCVDQGKHEELMRRSEMYRSSALYQQLHSVSSS
ncbi:ABC multidrug transporter SitT [Microthyrium microscopicum]|uniref:ABC multidrug transporter SitT n=1 Tax=Microthyrium microscopicum TaxID=703497 RepID=A0A6A6U4A1_9PEZI|nr:ABC multidrug transporter SitT [Microthyrium microscopicum]